MAFRNNHYFTRQYCGKTDKGFLKFNYEIFPSHSGDTFIFWVTVEGKRNWKILFDVEIW